MFRSVSDLPTLRDVLPQVLLLKEQHEIQYKMQYIDSR